MNIGDVLIKMDCHKDLKQKKKPNSFKIYSDLGQSNILANQSADILSYFLLWRL